VVLRHACSQECGPEKWDVSVGRPVLVANAAHVQIIAEQMEAAGIDDHLVILEPFGRNTAPAIALASLKLNLATLCWSCRAITPSQMMPPSTPRSPERCRW